MAGDAVNCQRDGCNRPAKKRGKFCSGACRAAYHRQHQTDPLIGEGIVRGISACNGGFVLVLHFDDFPRLRIGDEVAVRTHLYASQGRPGAK